MYTHIPGLAQGAWLVWTLPFVNCLEEIQKEAMIVFYVVRILRQTALLNVRSPLPNRRSIQPIRMLLEDSRCSSLGM